MSSIVKSAATVAAGAVAGNISKSASKRALKAQARQDAKMKKRRGAGWEPAPTDLLPSVNKRGKGCRRFKVVLSYEGAGFHGWMQQFPPGQAPLRTIEGVVQTSFRQAIGQRVRVHPAGRTDAGVNATGQVCQFDAETTEDTQPMAQRINEHLPPDCRVRSIEHVPQSFTAMGCLWKRYVYTIPAGTQSALVSFCRRSLQQQHGHNPEGVRDGDTRISDDLAVDVPRMNAAAAILTGRHDFAAFQSKGGRKNTVRTLYNCTVCRVGVGAEPDASEEHADTGRLRLVFEGDGFLYNMVRILSGTLLEVGCGLRTLEQTAALVAPLDPAAVAAAPGATSAKAVPSGESEDATATRAAADAALATVAIRGMSGPTLAAECLCLEHVEYEQQWSATNETD